MWLRLKDLEVVAELIRPLLLHGRYREVGIRDSPYEFSGMISIQHVNGGTLIEITGATVACHCRSVLKLHLHVHDAITVLRRLRALSLNQIAVQ